MLGIVEVVVLEVDATRLYRVRGVRLRDAESVGKVLERVTGGVEVDTENLAGWKPARWSRVEWPEIELKEVDGGREGVEVDDLSSSSSDRLKSGGGGVLSKLSSINGGKDEEGAAKADSSGWVLGALERATESWSLRMDISTPVSLRECERVG